MFEWWLTRHRIDDAPRALQAVEAAARDEFRVAMADYDAFVHPAKRIRDGLLIGTARSSAGENVSIRLPWGGEYAHALIQGGTGTGKTTFVAGMLREELRARRPVGVIDCKGDLFHTMTRIAAAVAHTVPETESSAFRSRLVVVNPFGDTLVPLNVCRPLAGISAEVQAFDIVLVLSRLFDASMGLHMETIARHLLMLLIESGLSLVEAPALLEDEVLRGVLASRSKNEVVKSFFLSAYAAIPQVSKDALINRLRSLLLAENIRLMLGAETLLDLHGILDRGDPMFVFLGKGPAVPEEQVEILGSLFLQLLFQATYARGSGRRSQYLIAVDEFVHLLGAPAIARRFETALTAARSFGLSLMLMHHNFAQLPSALREALLGNADLVALFRTSGRNAAFFGDFLPETDPANQGKRAGGEAGRVREQLEALQRLPDRHCYWYDRRKPHRAVRLRVPDSPLPHAIAGMRENEFEQLVGSEGWEVGAVALPRETLRRQIENRKERLAELLRPPVTVRRPTEKGSPRPSKIGRGKGKVNLG